MNIKITDKLKKLCPEINLGLLIGDIVVTDSLEKINSLLNIEVEKIKKNYTMENYKTQALESGKKLYRKLGKDPSRYRISSDSLYRRIIKNKGVYYVNNVVDINNIISLRTSLSIGAYDLDKISGNIIYDVGRKEEIYKGIGRGILNIENLPVLKDDLGPFGSATSDSLRTMVTKDTKRVLMVIHSFDKSVNILDSLNQLSEYLKEYSEGKNIEIII